MGFMDQLKRIANPYAEDEEFDDYTPAASPDPQPARRESTPRYNFSSQNDASERKDKVVSIPTTNQQQVVLVSTVTFETATDIADHLAARRIVLLNLESTPKDDARRIIDFLSGAIYALDGKLKKVAISTFVLAPSNVDVSGELLEELENNGLYV